MDRFGNDLQTLNGINGKELADGQGSLEGCVEYPEIGSGTDVLVKF